VTRRYDDPARDVIAVRRDSGGADPAQFLWRGRLYVVRRVLSRWVEVGAWWRSRLPDGLPARVDPAGRQVWRVEAAAGGAAPGGVYDLAYDEAAASWTLARALD
jgi:Family of unknown function (DUF6504)